MARALGSLPTAPMLVMISEMLVDAMLFSGYHARARRDPLAPPNLAPAALPSPVSQSGARADAHNQCEDLSCPIILSMLKRS